MRHSPFDVAIVGAGCAGLTAAIALARAGCRVTVIEAADFPGAENWSGCVYFTENLAAPDALGPDGVEALAWERRLVERGTFATDGHGLLGATYRDPAAFRHCYTVLRPLFDQHLALVAQAHGAALLSPTTAESLIRDEGRVIGVCTNRGPLYADLVFLAEGDASHLVTREGYERSSDPRDAPRFLLGIKQIIELPPGAVEERFGLGPEEGAAYQILLRNGTVAGKRIHLNVSGFLITNRGSLSVGLMLPADHLARHFAGSPARLLEWFENLPALRPWLRDGRRSTFGAKVLRGGGLRDLPHLIDDGLAIGGAASTLGTDFPFLNFIGPATATGLLLARAVVRIRAEGGDFDRDALARHYLEPLRQTCYWKDAEYLRRWPGYVKRTRVLFDGALDVALGSAHTWTRPGGWFFGRLIVWLRLLRHWVGPGRWGELEGDLLRLGWALRLRAMTGRPALGRLLLDGSLNALRDLLRRPRAGLPPAGKLRLHYSRADGTRRIGQPPFFLRRWFARFAPVLAAAAGGVYRNDAVPLPHKLMAAGRLLLRQVNLLDLLAVAVLTVAGVVSGVLRTGWNRLWRRQRRPLPKTYRVYADAASRAACLPTAEARLPLPPKERPAFSALSRTHVNVLWPRALADKDVAVTQGPWSVCPGEVFEARVGSDGLAWVAVHADRCLKCEACWRVSDGVDWGRDGRQRLVYPVSSPVVMRLTDAADKASVARPALPRATDRSASWGLTPSVRLEDVRSLLDQLEHKLEEFDRALDEEPRTIDRARAEYLETLARYAHQLAAELAERLHHGTASTLAAALLVKAEKRSRRTWDSRFAWAAADGRQLHDHHLAELRRLLGLTEPERPIADAAGAPKKESREWQTASENPLLALANRLCQQVVTFATTRTFCPGRFRDERGRNAAGKFGVVKRRVARAAAHRFLVETLVHQESLSTLAAGGADLPSLARALIADLLSGCSTDALPSEVFREHGERLLRDWRADGSLLARTEDAELSELIGRKVLEAEVDEVRRHAARLTKQANDWLTRRGRPTNPATQAEIAEALGRQDAHLLASQILLPQTHARLERGLDAETALPLLRVWLDEAATSLDGFAALVRRRLNPPGRRDHRPFVEPGNSPPPASWSDFLAVSDPYHSSDFLALPVDLLRPRLTPDVVPASLPLSRLEPSPANRAFERFAARVSRFLVQIHESIEKSHAIISGKEIIPDAVAWRLQQMEEDVFSAEALAFDVAGRLARAGTMVPRLEAVSARLILAKLAGRAKEMASEIQKLIQPADHVGADLSPAREGSPATRELRMDLSRFFLLQGLVEVAAPRWRAEPRRTPRHLGREALELEALKAGFRQSFDAAIAVFGRGLWQNPNLQGSVFPLAETAAWLLVADALLGRLAWVVRRAQASEDAEPAALVMDLGRRALARCFAEIGDRLRRFGEELPSLRRGYYAAHVRAASLILDPPATAPVKEALPNRISRPLAVLVVVAPVPRTAGSQTLEGYWRLNPGDRSALELALRLRDAAPDMVTVRVVAYGPKRAGLALREILSLGVEQVRLVETKGTALPALVVPEAEAKADLLLGGASEEQGAAFVERLAEEVGIPFAGRGARLAVEDAADGSRAARLGADDVRLLPLAVAIEPGLELPPFTVEGWLKGLEKEIKTVPAAKS
jgi:electron transfer flavoprotein-quinone oxidoreductase